MKSDWDVDYSVLSLSKDALCLKISPLKGLSVLVLASVAEILALKGQMMDMDHGIYPNIMTLHRKGTFGFLRDIVFAKYNLVRFVLVGCTNYSTLLSPEF